MAACRTALYDWCAKEAHYTCACFSTSVFVTDDSQSYSYPKKVVIKIIITIVPHKIMIKLQVHIDHP